MTKRSLFFILSFLLLQVSAMAQHGGHEQHNTPAAPAHEQAPTAQPEHGTAPAAENHSATTAEANHGTADAHAAPTEYDPTPSIMNHIANANEFHLFGQYSIPLPCIMYLKDGGGVKTFMSSVFHHGAKAYDGFVSDHGVVKRVIDPTFPQGEVELEGEQHGEETHYVHHEGADEIAFVHAGGKKYELEKASGLFTPTSFYDFSITKNVFTMIMAGLILLLMFTSAAKSYATRKGLAPKGMQNLLEVVVQFITDEVAKPMIGEKKYMKFLPYLLTIFFFILANNLIGLIPFAPFGANVTGNIATTAALALIAFLVTNLNGKADYWKHILWMPGVPVPMKIFLAPIELLGVFTKPISLMIRLFANITAGHIIILALVSLIFVFGKAGSSVAGSATGAFVAVPFTLFLSIIEVIVAFIQAFIFTILTASYIGAAIEEHHHDEAHH